MKRFKSFGNRGTWPRIHGREKENEKRGGDTCINLYDTYARRTCPISYLSVTSDMLSYVRPSRRARHPNGMAAFTYEVKTNTSQSLL